MLITLADKPLWTILLFADTRLLRADAHCFCQTSGITNSIFRTVCFPNVLHLQISVLITYLPHSVQPPNMSKTCLLESSIDKLREKVSKKRSNF